MKLGAIGEQLFPQLFGVRPQEVRERGPVDHVQRTPLSPEDARLISADGQQLSFPVDGRTFTIGRHPDCELRVGNDCVSRKHALGCWKDGQLWVRDQSSNGTFVNGERVAPERWVAVPNGSDLALGGNEARFRLGESFFVPPPVQETRLPDGRAALIRNLSDGRLEVSKVDSVMTPQQAKDSELFLLDKEKGLQPGAQVFMTVGGRPACLTYFGDDARGNLRFGHTDTYTPQQYQKYVQAQQDHLEAEKLERMRRADRREIKRQEVREREMTRLGLTEQMLKENTVEAAGRIFNEEGKLGADGLDLWPKSVSDLVEGWKRKEIEQQPVLGLDGGNLTAKEAGVSELRLQAWKAEQRGEFLLFRGNKGAYNAEGEAPFWTNEFGSAVSYALGAEESTLLGLSVPMSDLPRFYRNVGALPGRAPYAEVYEIYSQDLDAQRKPAVLMSSRTPEHRQIFERYQVNAQIEDAERGAEDFRRLDRWIHGR